MIEGQATARYVRTSAQKAKLVMDLIRGREVDAALATLRFTRKGVARDIAKVLRSAISNAQQKEGASGETDRLYAPPIPNAPSYPMAPPAVTNSVNIFDPDLQVPYAMTPHGQAAGCTFFQARYT